ncbi:hypothetical protein [Burkholderia cenocepacia]|nr:hypothetical protein [Burkholderia cenocepacia]
MTTINGPMLLAYELPAIARRSVRTRAGEHGWAADRMIAGL